MLYKIILILLFLCISTGQSQVTINNIQPLSDTTVDATNGYCTYAFEIYFDLNGVAFEDLPPVSNITFTGVPQGVDLEVLILQFVNIGGGQALIDPQTFKSTTGDMSALVMNFFNTPVGYTAGSGTDKFIHLICNGQLPPTIANISIENTRETIVGNSCTFTGNLTLDIPTGTETPLSADLKVAGIPSGLSFTYVFSDAVENANQASYTFTLTSAVAEYLELGLSNENFEMSFTNTNDQFPDLYCMDPITCQGVSVDSATLNSDETNKCTFTYTVKINVPTGQDIPESTDLKLVTTNGDSITNFTKEGTSPSFTYTTKVSTEIGNVNSDASFEIYLKGKIFAGKGTQVTVPSAVCNDDRVSSSSTVSISFYFLISIATLLFFF
ncbi:hypothetical protein DLAC_11804 [Tieghemostelium lacteum]|uniref:Uncharacterized protein n=1 Tax=Tieghemostelium lacteum TaxID=361077 RepID=A0A151Z624_TIELA|nr:hypothetical protein DLAC_11804 [Tieghemostelium lacteum]|eukprot:KYQ89387.1 hypothetical protein DLAC_11804 [Tieghemostelium lacteum]